VADRIEVTVIVDNYIDIFLPPTTVASYPSPGNESRLLAEQGLSLWVKVSTGQRVTQLLYDFGRSENVFAHNARILGLDITRLDHLVLSHGHVDHYGALGRVMKETADRCKLFVHPVALTSKRCFQLPDGTFIGPWGMERRLLEDFSERIHARSEPSMLAPDIYISGAIARKTAFEHGMTGAFVETGGGLVHDDIPDDQALYMDLEGKGIVVLTGCCHSGLINTIMKGQELFPDRRIYAVLGGFHLNSVDQRQMNATLDHLAQLDVAYIGSLHCTGYYAQKVLMERFEAGWIPGTVGLTVTLKS